MKVEEELVISRIQQGSCQGHSCVHVSLCVPSPRGGDAALPKEWSGQTPEDFGISRNDLVHSGSPSWMRLYFDRSLVPRCRALLGFGCSPGEDSRAPFGGRTPQFTLRFSDDRIFGSCCRHTVSRSAVGAMGAAYPGPPGSLSGSASEIAAIQRSSARVQASDDRTNGRSHRAGTRLTTRNCACFGSADFWHTTISDPRTAYPHQGSLIWGSL